MCPVIIERYLPDWICRIVSSFALTNALTTFMYDDRNLLKLKKSSDGLEQRKGI